MNHLHPYWRMQYVAAPKPLAGASVFEDIPNATDDKSVHLLYRGKKCYLVLNRFPYNAGHLLAVPYRAVASPAELDSDERAELFDVMILGQEILARAFKPDGFNIGFNIGAAAGAGIPKHLHAHIVPRWNGDNNFMPVLSDTRILVDSLDAIWEKLRKELAVEN